MSFALAIIFLIFVLFPCEANALAPHEDSETLWLINSENILDEDFRPRDLVKFRGMEMRACARDAYAEMLAAMESDGIFGLRLQSAYRSFSHQRAIFERHVKLLSAKGKNSDEAREITARSIQIPGASEHHLGLALDVSVNGKLSREFSETPAGKWLSENSHKYGFIIRYPQEKSAVTKIIYEPWHLRFVGVPHAQIMHEESLALEEYIEFIKKIPMYVVWCENFYFVIFFGVATEISDEIFHISATEKNNNGGYIITLIKSKNLVYNQ